MNRFISFIFSRRVLTILGFIALAICLVLLAAVTGISYFWVLAIFVLAVIIYAALWWWKKKQQERKAAEISKVMESEADRAVEAASPDKRSEVEALRARMLEAIKTIKTSKLGEASGSAALYELPWYLVIGNPAAGKSSAIVNSGLHFPFSDVNGSVIHGIGGTRDCDWFFTSEGILLDTAGRYSTYESDRTEWISFLHLLKKYRSKAPVNGIVIAASIAELSQNTPDYASQLARQLRSRVQELSSELGVFAPIYVMFTKVDLIGGFAEFFEDADASERERTWGATLPYDADGKTQAVAAFEQQFSQLMDGLHELSVKRMAMSLDGNIGPGVLSFPLEFAAVLPHLRAFISTLFEENPFQYKPVFRGFYFTSAVRDGTPVTTSDERMAEQFGLATTTLERQTSTGPQQNAGFFLSDLFSKVIFADKGLVRQFTSRAHQRARLITFGVAVLVLSIAISGWCWSYLANQKLLHNVQADLNQAIALQKTHTDIGSRMQAIELIQDRISQLQRFRKDKPLELSFGLYQGDAVEQQLRAEYFKGINQILLSPVKESIETYLADVNTNADKLAPQGSAPQADASAPAASQQTGQNAAQAQMTIYREVSPTNVEDAYNALKTYLMLANHQHLEPGHLNDQITRFWRVWLDTNRGSIPREQMIKSAEHILTFFLTQIDEPDFPVIDNKLVLVDQTRNNLRRVVHGMPARQRVYAEIKARAATRFAPLTVANIVGDTDSKIVAGSYAISGAFTREAWEKYVAGAIREAANKELQSSDWVLQTQNQEDLTLQGSPDQIQKALTDMYKADYVTEWKKFLQGVTITGFADFDTAVNNLNRLGDPSSSPIKRLMETLYNETSWDNASVANRVLGNSAGGFSAWFKAKVLRQAPTADTAVAALNDGSQVGIVGREFTAISALMMPRGENKEVLFNGYLTNLSRLRTRFNQMKTGGDPGPAARQLMQQTFEGGSELSEGLKFVDESMLVGLSDSQRATIRPLLVRPLMESFSVIITPAQGEINKVWQAQVLDPFNQNLASKYPFQENSRIEAAPNEIAQVFGPDGAIAKFASGTLAPLVIQRGQSIVPRTWSDRGIVLNDEFTVNYPRYIAQPGSSVSSSGGAASGAPETVFQILPSPAAGFTEYTIEIDGQALRYRNGAATWTRFQWPGSGTPGARVSGVTFDGKSVELLNIPGNYGLQKMIEKAKRQRHENGDFDLTWGDDKASVSVVLRIISQSSGNSANSSSPAPRATLKGLTLPTSVVGRAATVTTAPAAASSAPRS